MEGQVRSRIVLWGGAKGLAQIETYVHELQTLARPGEIRQDIREERFIEHTLQIAVQAALDVAAHIVADERMGEPRTNRGLFDLLESHGWIPGELATEMRRMVDFRNVIIYGYGDVDLDIVEEIVRHHLGDLLRFVQVVRGRL
jgi:uncharacterized protein YutE (UPF0331/DUF86 family)